MPEESVILYQDPPTEADSEVILYQDPPEGSETLSFAARASQQLKAGWSSSLQGLAALTPLAGGSARDAARTIAKLGPAASVDDPDLRAFHASDGWMATMREAFNDPYTIPLTAIQGIGSSVLPMVSGAVGAAGGPVPAALGVGIGSGLVEAGSKLLESLQEMGVDTQDPLQLEAAYNNPKLIEVAKRKAIAKGAVVGAFGAMSMGMAGRLFKVAKGAAGKLGSLGIETVEQAAMGGAGEAGGQLAAGDKVQPADVYAEIFGEAVPGAGQVLVGSLIREKAPLTAVEAAKTFTSEADETVDTSLPPLTVPEAAATPQTVESPESTVIDAAAESPAPIETATPTETTADTPVAPAAAPEATATTMPLEQAAEPVLQEDVDAKISRLKNELKSAWDDQFKMGITPDPTADLRLYKTLVKLAFAYAQKGIQTVGDFIQRITDDGWHVPKEAAETAWSAAVAGVDPEELVHTPDEMVGVAGAFRPTASQVLPPNAQTPLPRKPTTAFQWLRTTPEFVRDYPDIEVGTYLPTTEETRLRVADTILQGYQGDYLSAFADATSPMFFQGLSDDNRDALVAKILVDSKAASRGKFEGQYADVHRQAVAWLEQSKSQAGQSLQGAAQIAALIAPEAWAERLGRLAFDRKQEALPGIVGPAAPEAVRGAANRAGRGAGAQVNTEKAVEEALGKATKSESVRLDYESEAIGKIMGALDPPGSGPKPALQEFYDRAVKTLTDAAKKAIGVEPNRPEIDPAAQLRKALARIGGFASNREIYNDLIQSVRNAAAEMLEMPKSIAEQFEALRPLLDFNPEDPVHPKLLDMAAKQAGINLRELLMQHDLAKEEGRKALVDGIMNDPALRGLTNADKAALAQKLYEQWQAKRKQLFHAELQAATASLPERKAIVKNRNKLLKLINIGAMSDQDFYNAIAPEFGLPSYTPEIANRIKELAEKMQQAPEGIPRNQRHQELLDYIKAEAGISNWELGKSYWYNSVLSGFATQYDNFFAATTNVITEMMLQGARHPSSIPGLFGAWWRGMQYGLTEWDAIVRRGDFTNRIASEVSRHANPLEIWKAHSALGKAMQSLRYVGRLMAIADTVNANAAFEVRSTWLAREAAIKKRGFGAIPNDSELHAAMEQILGIRPEDERIALEQAKAEAANGAISEKDVRRRQIELMRKNRPPELLEDAQAYSLRATFNNKPEGFLGGVAKVINQLKESNAVANVILTPIMPFVNTPANVGNAIINYSPIGWLRLAEQKPHIRKMLIELGLEKHERGIPQMSQADLDLLRAKVIAGHTAFILAIAALQAARWNDPEDPILEITGGWAKLPPARRSQLYSQGRKPWSIRVGNTSVSYKNTPFALLLGTLGSAMDSLHYAKEPPESIASMVANAAWNGALIVKDMSFLSGLTGLVELVGQGASLDMVERNITTLLARSVGGLIPNAIRDVESWFDPAAYKANGVWETFLREVPVARRLVDNKLIDVLGRPVEIVRTPWRRHVFVADLDPLEEGLRKLAGRGIFLPVPTAASKIGRGGERRQMSPSEFNRYQIAVGEAYRQVLPEILPDLLSMPVDEAKIYLDRVTTRARNFARRSVRMDFTEEVSELAPRQ